MVLTYLGGGPSNGLRVDLPQGRGWGVGVVTDFVLNRRETSLDLSEQVRSVMTFPLLVGVKLPPHFEPHPRKLDHSRGGGKGVVDRTRVRGEDRD